MANPNAFRSSLGRALRLSQPRSTVFASSTTGNSTPFVASAVSTTASFSTSASNQKRKTRDNNRLRGVSSLRRTGPREPLSVSFDPLPKPSDYKPKVETDKDHGLWGFFGEQGKLLNTPADDGAHGRAWTAQELRQKSWEDLHALWWACCRERNRIATANAERARANIGFGEYESNNRDDAVKRTMKAIKHVLTERYYLWEDAYQLAQEDPEINLSGEGPAYAPLYEEADHFVDEPAAEASSTEASPAAEKSNSVDPSTIPSGNKATGQSQNL